MADRRTYADHRRKRLALHLKTIRRSLGLSEQDVADRAGYKSGTMITAIENTTRQVDDDKIKDIANALGVSISQLLGYRKIEMSDKGWPKLSDSEKTALMLLAPMIEVLDEKAVEYLLDTGMLLCRAGGVTPEWKQPEYMSKKARSGEDE